MSFLWIYLEEVFENLDQPYTDKLFADQVIDLMNKLNIDSAKLIGLSNGGRVISKVAELKPMQSAH